MWLHAVRELELTGSSTEVRVIIAASCGKMTTLNLWMGAERLFAAKLEKIRCKNVANIESWSWFEYNYIALDYLHKVNGKLFTVCVRKCRKRCVRIKNRMEIQRSGSNNLDRSGDHCIFYRNRKETGAGKEPERETIPRLFTICSAML